MYNRGFKVKNENKRYCSFFNCFNKGIYSIFILFLFNFMFLLIFTTQVGANTILKFGSNLPNSHPWIVGFNEFNKKVSNISNDDLKIEFLPQVLFDKGTDVLNELKRGKIDITVVDAAVLSNQVASMKVFQLPFLFHDVYQAEDLIFGTVGANLLNEFKNYGYSGISFLPSTFPYLLTQAKPITSLDDIQGLRIDTWSTPTTIKAYKSIGIIPTTIPLCEVYSGMKMGAIDGIITYPSPMDSFNLYEVTNYITEFPMSYNPGIIIMNERSWESLTQSHKNAIIKSVPSAIKIIQKQIDDQKEKVIHKEKTTGIKSYKFGDIPSFKNASEQVFLDLSKEIPGNYSNILYNVAYRTFNLDVMSFPKDADVYYSRRIEPSYTKYKDSTNCTIPNLYYATYKVKVSLAGYKTEEKTFDPFTEEKKQIIFYLTK